MKKVLLGLSGGVDSCASALILLEKGYEVIGVTMVCPCCPDATGASALAKRLGIEHHVVSMDEEWGKIRDYIRDSYRCGLTPNPCVVCNEAVKFAALRASFAADFFATGHYARIIGGELHKAVFEKKDQSYFLARVRKEQLEGVIFPLGGLTKDDARKIAADAGYSDIAENKESQDLGALKLDDIPHFTIGQRKGLGVAKGVPMFVKDIDPATGEITLGTREELMSNSCSLEEMRLAADFPRTCEVKVRYRSAAIAAEIDGTTIHFAEPVFAITPGQLAVLYSGTRVIGSGFIKR